MSDADPLGDVVEWLRQMGKDSRRLTLGRNNFRYDEAADEIKKLREAREMMQLDAEKYRGEAAQLRTERDEDNVRLEQFNAEHRKEISQLQWALAMMWQAFNTENNPPFSAAKIAKQCYDSGRGGF